MDKFRKNNPYSPKFTSNSKGQQVVELRGKEFVGGKGLKELEKESPQCLPEAKKSDLLEE